MPTKQRVQLRNVQNVAASKTALIDIPCGPRYHYIVLEHTFGGGTNSTAGAASNITEIRVKVNDRVQRTFSGTQLRDLNLLNGTAYDCQGSTPNTTPVSFPIFFAEPWMLDEVDQDALAWKTNLWNSFKIEVDLSTGTTPTLLASAVIDGVTAKQQELITKVIRMQFGASGTKFDFANMDRRDWLRVLSLYPDSGGSNALTPVTLRTTGSKIWHELTNTANKALITNFGLTPAASGRTSNIYDIVLDHDGLLDGALNLDNEKEATLTIEAGSTMSGTVTGILQRMGLPE